MVSVSGQGRTGTAISVADKGALSFAGNPRIDPSKILVAGTAKANFGNVVVGANGTVSIDWPFLLPSDWIDVRRIAGTGDYRIAHKPGAGFTITGTPGDELSWKVA